MGHSRTEQEPPWPRLDTSRAHLKDLSHSRYLARIPQLPKGKGLGAGLGLVPAAGRKRHRSLFPPLMEVSGPGQDNLQFPGECKGSCWEGWDWTGWKGKRTGALKHEQLSLSMRPGGERCGKEQPPRGVSGGCHKHSCCFPVRPEPLLSCPAQPPTPQSGPVCCADLTSAKSGDSRGHWELGRQWGGGLLDHNWARTEGSKGQSQEQAPGGGDCGFCPPYILHRQVWVGRRPLGQPCLQDPSIPTQNPCILPHLQPLSSSMPNSPS